MDGIEGKLLSVIPVDKKPKRNCLFLKQGTGNLLFDYYGEVPEEYAGRKIRITVEPEDDMNLTQKLTVVGKIPEDVPRSVETLKPHDSEYDYNRSLQIYSSILRLQ